MKQTLIISLLLSVIFNAKGQSYIYKGRQDTIPVTMLASSLFATDYIKKIGDSSTGVTRYPVANVYQIRGYMVSPEHPSDPYFLDENKKRIVLLHIWMSVPYNYHVPAKL